MNMKKIFAAMAATAVSASAFAAMSFTNASAADQIGQATLMGSFGTESSWDYTGAKASVVAIDGDAQYECTWTVAEATTPGDSCFLTVVIEPAGSADNFTTATFPDLTASLDEVWVDGVQLTDFDASAAVDANYYEGNNPGVTRIYLRGDWANNSTRVLANDQAINSEIKVLFSVAGTGQEGTSNVVEEEPATDPVTDPTTEPETDAPTEGDTTTTAPESTDDTTTTTTTAPSADLNANKKTTTTTKASSNGGKNETSANTGDAGVGIAVAALAVAGAAAFVARKKD